MTCPPLEAVAPRTALERLQPMLDHIDLSRPLLVATDFDGTVADTGTDPWAAAIRPAARRALRAMAGRRDVRVCFISGRTCDDLAGRARVGAALYLGNHGAERADLARGARPERMSVVRRPAGDGIEAICRRLASEVPRDLPEPWLFVEHKFPTGVTFHFRGAPDVDAARHRVRASADRIDAQRLLVRHESRRALELRDGSAPTKASTLRELLDELRPAVAVMLGDDRHDAQALEALRAWRGRTEGQGLALAVAGHADAAVEVAAAADLVLGGPAQASRFLSGLARLVSSG